MEENKNELTVLVAMVVVIGLFIYFMPDIEHLIFGQPKREKSVKTETKVEKEETNKVITGKATYTGSYVCGSTLEDDSTVKYTVSYEDSIVTTIIEETSKIYPSKNNLYTKAVSECENVNTKYLNHSGFKASCVVNDLTITKTYEYTLNKFETFKVTENNIEETIALPYTIQKGDDYKMVAEIFKDAGASCK